MTVDIPTCEEIEAALAQVEKKENFEFARAFRDHTGPGWGLLAQVFSLWYQRRNAQAPFAPTVTLEGLTEAQLDALRPTLDCVSDPEFRARVADILWLRRGDHVAARIAVEAYLESGMRLEDPKHWVAGMERYERAIRLARLLGKSDPLFDKSLSHLLERVRHYDGGDKSWLTHRGLSLLYEFQAGNPSELAALAAKVAARASAERDFRRAWEHFEHEAKFHRRAGDTTKANEAMRARAERMADEAEVREGAGSFIAAHKFWNDAIQAYRSVPGSADRIKELHRRLNIAGEKMRSEMQTTTIQIDVSEKAKRAKELLTGKSFEDALCILAAIARPIDPIPYRSEIEQMIADSPFQATIAAGIFDGAGRKVDVRPPALTGDPAERERAMLGFMAYYADPYRLEAVAGSIAPAMRQMLSEHGVYSPAIEAFVKESAFIPDGRVSIFARGIRFGFEWDISTALHLLIPQVENALRALLAQQGTITTALDAVGIEEAWPLGKILNESALADMLGNAHVYELRSLLLGQPGSNFRNLLAHGLLGDEHLAGHGALYLWWLILRIVVMHTPTFRSFVESCLNEPKG
ncbi:MAG: DUF4209 domain-containing protein [Kiloniellales bacterium]